MEDVSQLQRDNYLKLKRIRDEVVADPGAEEIIRHILSKTAPNLHKAQLIKVLAEPKEYAESAIENIQQDRSQDKERKMVPFRIADNAPERVMKAALNRLKSHYNMADLMKISGEMSHEIQRAP